MIEVLGIITTVLAVTGAFLINRMNIACFYLWVVSNSISAAVHVSCGPWSLVARDIIFLVLAIEGIWKWRKIRKPSKEIL